MNLPVLFTATLLCATALAQEPDPAVLAEQSRLSSEMQRLASRETWEGVEGLYRQLLALEDSGAQIVAAEHLLGAQAARARGDVSATLARLRRARSAGEYEVSVGWIADIEANYGPVVLTVPPRRRDEYTLTAARPPFQSDRRFAIDYGHDSIVDEAAFKGYLPVGDYTLGDVTFSVIAAQTTRIDLTGRRAKPEPEPAPAPVVNTPPREPREPRPAREASPSAGLVMGHLRLGVGLGSVGATRRAGIEPLPFQGVSPGGALGAAWHSASGFGGGAELGGMMASAGDEQLALGYLWAFAVWQKGALSLSLGPAVGGGRATLVGLDGGALQQYCAEVPARDCVGLTRSVAMVETATTSGRVQASGGALGADITVAQTSAVRWALGVDLGALSDGARWYSWGRLSVVARFGKGD